MLHKKIKILIGLFMAVILCSCSTAKEEVDTFTILSSSENKDLEQMLTEFASENKINLSFEYTGSLNIPSKITSEQNKYDAVWSSNSIWNASIPSSVLKYSKAISINPVIFAVKQSKYYSLNFSKDTVVSDLVSAVESNNLKFLMPSVTQTNSGASAYLGFLNCLAGNPPVLTEEDLDSKILHENLKKLFNGVLRNSGSDEYLIDIFSLGDYDAVVNYESSLIKLNKKLIKEKKEPLIFIYPSDGVSISDSPFAYVDNKNDNKLEEFKLLQNFLLSQNVQKKLEETGRRTSYGGLVSNDDVFKASYGIDKNSYLSPIKYPASSVIKKALTLYQDLLRKPAAVVFCLDYSGSMTGAGNMQLVDAMNKILNHEEASKDLIQFSEKDKIFVIPFESEIRWIKSAESGVDTYNLIYKIKTEEPYGNTNIYKPIENAMEVLSDFDSETFTKSIVLMTDGKSNEGYINSNGYNIPVYSIMFGQANPEQLNQLSKVSKGKTFDGKKSLVDAFKEIRAYN